MKAQKKIAMINDISGYGRCSITVSMPIISAMKMQSCLLPTSIFSAHTGFPDYVFTDYTDKMTAHMEHWEKLHLQFDGIMTGFLGSKEQIQIVWSFIQKFKSGHTLVVVDPIMGDYGKLYPTYTDEMCAGMKKIVECADIVTPNLTEACRLADEPYPDQVPNDADLFRLCRKIEKLGPEKIVITGIDGANEILNYVYECGHGRFIRNEKVGSYRSGTGDVFSAVVTGDMVRHYPNGNLQNSVELAADYIVKCMKYTEQQGIPANCGLCFEEYLWELGKEE